MAEKLKILLLEDSVADAEMVSRFIKKEMGEPEFRLAMNKDAFLEALDEYEPDVILADNALPQFSASEALKIIHDRELNTPFILVTGNVSEEFAADIMKHGADDYILKDRLARLPSAMETATTKRRMELEKREAQQRLSLSEKRFRAIIEQFPYPVIICAPDGAVTGANLAWEIMWDEKREITLGRNIRTNPHLVASGLAPRVESVFTGHLAQSEPYLFDPTLSGKLGKKRWLQILLYPLKNQDGSVLEVILILLDVTSNKEGEVAVQRMNEELRELSAHLQDIREEERLSIAREIHDELGQQLTAIKMDVAWIRKKFGGENAIIRGKTETIAELLNGAILTVRKIASELRPTILDDLGLVESLKWQSKEFEQKTGLVFKFNHDIGELRVPPDLSIGLFRIFQESLTNIARHAQATEVNASLILEGVQLALRITDNGKGFDLQLIQGKRTLGLLGMKERMIMMGGVYEIQSQPGLGTTVWVRVPLPSRLSPQ
jgi:two-component system sensor histidine kinase UhpB